MLDVADVLTSSGHGGRFSFGVISRKQVSANADLMDRAFDDAFGVKARKTLTINCLPMGVVFSSHCMTVATTSVREDMAVALVETFGHHYEQIVLCGDPLFMKRFTDYARERGVDWSRYRRQHHDGGGDLRGAFPGLPCRVRRLEPRPARPRLHRVVIRSGRTRPPSVLRDAGDHQPAARGARESRVRARPPRRPPR